MSSERSQIIARGAPRTGSVDDGRDPQAPPLTRVTIGRYLNVLDLDWAYGWHYDVYGDSGRHVWPLIQGACVAPPPLEPNDKGKGPLLPLSGVADFAIKYEAGNVYKLLIRRPGLGADAYYCNLAQPKDRQGWCASYKTYAEAANDGWVRQGDDGYARLGQSRARVDAWQMQEALPARGLVLAPPHGRAAPPTRAPPVSLALPPAPEVPVSPSIFTPEEARRRFKALGRALPPKRELVWGAYEGAHLLAVALVSQTHRSWLGRDKSPARAWQIYHAPLFQPWEAPRKAYVSGGGIFPLTEPGKGTTVRTDEGVWLMKLDIDDDGAKVATINGRRAASVEHVVRRGG